jgi:hypothetical protein
VASGFSRKDACGAGMACKFGGSHILPPLKGGSHATQPLMPIRYRNRERRLERTISRIETTRRAIARHGTTASEHEAWWRRHAGTLDAWRNAIAERQHRRPTANLAIAADRFQRWTSRLRWHPTALRLRLECWWLTLKLSLRGIGRGRT